MTQGQDAITGYREARSIVTSAVQAARNLAQWDQELYQNMQLTSVKLADVAKANPNATLFDALDFTLQRLSGTYHKIEEEIRNTEDRSIRGMYRNYLNHVTRVYVEYSTPILSVLQQSLQLSRVPIQEQLDELDRTMGEYRSTARKLDTLRRRDC